MQLKTKFSVTQTAHVFSAMLIALLFERNKMYVCMYVITKTSYDFS